jgi:hypothetical protein
MISWITERKYRFDIQRLFDWCIAMHIINVGTFDIFYLFTTKKTIMKIVIFWLCLFCSCIIEHFQNCAQISVIWSEN